MRFGVCIGVALVPFALAPIHALAVDEPRSDTADLHVIVGASATYKPDYAGSDRLSWSAKPLLSVRYKGLGLSTGGLGELSAAGGTPAAQGLSFNYNANEQLRLGAALRTEQGRRESDNPLLRGMGNTPSTIRGNVYARYALTNSINLSVLLAPDLLGRGAGLSMSIGAGTLLWSHGQWKLLGSAGVSIADKPMMQRQFGVDAGQSARTGLNQYYPRAGAKDTNLSLSLSYRIHKDAMLSGRVSGTQLTQQAARSPLVKREFQPSFTLGAAYSF